MTVAGYIVGTNKKPDISDNVTNWSALFTGGSGNGKTEAIKKTLEESAKAGRKCLAINYNGTFDDKLLDVPDYHVIRVKKEGIPIPLLESFSSEHGGSEEDSDVCEAIADVLSQVKRLGYVDRNFLEEACQNALIFREIYEDDMECLCDGASLLEKDGDKRLKAKFHNIFGRVKFHQKWDLWRPGKVTVLDLSGYPHSTQILLAQLVLSVLWRYHQVYGQQTDAETMVALDEFQNLPLKNNSILEQILREGRKFNLSLLLATQTIYTFNMAQRAVLQQPGTKFYFKPVEAELKKIAKQFPDIAAADAERLLQGLGIGECLACGEFVIAGSSKLRTLKVTFREKG